MRKLIKENGLFEEKIIGASDGDLKIMIADNGVVDEMVRKHHYSHKSTKNRFLSLTVNDNLGFLQLGYGIRPAVKHNISDEITRENYCEFDRMWLSDIMPKYSETRVIGLLIFFLKHYDPKKKFIITYADGSVGNRGTIYKASNAFQIGKIPVDFYILPSGERVHPVTMWHRHKTRAKKFLEEIYPGIVHIKGTEFQYRFLYILDKKARRRFIRKNYGSEISLGKEEV